MPESIPAPYRNQPCCKPHLSVLAVKYPQRITQRSPTRWQLQKKRLTLDIDPNLQRRLKAAAALKGITMREYCESVLEKELSQEQSNVTPEGKSRRQKVDELLARSRELTGGRKFPGNSADIIREERELRADQIDNRLK